MYPSVAPWAHAHRDRHQAFVVTAEVKLLAPDDARDEVLVAELVRIINGAYAVGEAGLWLEGTTRTGPGEIAEAIRSGGMLAATLDGRLVGCAYVRPLHAGTADLGMVSAAPERWGSGVGRELVRAAEDLMRARGVETMQLELLVPKEWVHPAKERLRAWYSRLGYRVVRTAPFEEVAPQLASQLATPCEFLIFHKPLKGGPGMAQS
jgi:GNAT superfamily N-acetyltransferase